MTLQPCYRASCDAPDCRASAMLPHARTGPVRVQLVGLGWSMLHVRGPARGGAARILYVCPEHRGWSPDAPMTPASGVSMQQRRWLRIRRGAMVWMLHGGGATYKAIAAAMGLSLPRVAEIAAMYERVVAGRARRTADWNEPWARRLRAAGAIR